MIFPSMDVLVTSGSIYDIAEKKQGAITGLIHAYLVIKRLGHPPVPPDPRPRYPLPPAFSTSSFTAPTAPSTPVAS